MKEKAERIKEAIIDKFGSVQDCCTTANKVFQMLYEDDYEIERIQGIVTDDGEEYDHEWLMVDGEFLDITAEQFCSPEYSGEPVDFHRMNKIEMQEVAEILAILAR